MDSEDKLGGPASIGDVTLSRTSKIVLTVSVLLGIGAYLAVVDFGVFAGRIHDGVLVSDLDVGGMTEEEALDLLEERIALMEMQAVHLVGETTECVIYPTDVGWRPRPFETAAGAMAVGRSGGPVRALKDRFSAWFSDVKVPWADSTNFTKMQAVLDSCEERVEATGTQLERVKLRFKIKRALVAWPRRDFRIPVES